MNWLFALLIPVIAGWLVCRLFQADSFSNRFCRRIAAGLGFGITSCAYFLTIAGGRYFLLGLELMLIASLAIAVYRIRQSSHFDSGFRNAPALISVTFWVVLLLQVVNFIVLSISNPHGQWDAWTIWNSHARFLYRSGSQWLENFSALQNWSHSGYPLLIPASIARAWQYLQNENVIVPIVIASSYTFSVIAVLLTVVQEFRNGSAAIIAAILLLATPSFIQVGVAQLADVPLAFFMLATFSLILFAERSNHTIRPIILAGICAGLAVWTKNEGILFLTSVFVTYCILLLNKKARLTRAVWFLAGLAPVLMVVLYFKLQIPEESYFLSQKSNLLVAHLFNGERYLIVLQAFLKQCLFPGGWKIPVVAVVLLYLLIGGAKPPETMRREILFVSFTICLLMMGYFFTYIITPLDLKWQLDTSIDRLFVQLWPSVLLVVALTAKVDL